MKAWEEEVNYKISELRDEWDHICNGVDMARHPFIGGNQCTICGVARSGKHVAKNWHEDTHWPTLLREILLGGWDVYFTLPSDGSYRFEVIFHTTGDDLPIHSEDLGGAVCLAWIRWKDSQHTDQH